MFRREFAKNAALLLASPLTSRKTDSVVAAENCGAFPEAKGITSYIGRFVVETTFESIPKQVVELGKKSILDGFGLALAGSKAKTGELCRQYVQSLGISDGKSVVIGTSAKTAPRFAAFANGISIHADDYDDTQLSSEKD